ncbi:hypothetical protein [Plantactinospora sonchi]|uniref:Uncharacterized protein n=1 Tax=Plantactinospora sonchi TaxID=1544735 RepID=A0ABU7S4W7_9ACTN
MLRKRLLPLAALLAVGTAVLAACDSTPSTPAAQNTTPTLRHSRPEQRKHRRARVVAMPV